MEKNHNEQFAELQEKYFEAREAGKKRADYWLNQMYELIKNIARNYIRAYCQKKGLVLGNREEKAHEASMYCIIQYLKKPGFKIDKISSYAHFGVIKNLFKDKDIEMSEVSYEQYFNEKERGAGK
jgi:GH35 family endo-1,4-beta-xylanase